MQKSECRSQTWKLSDPSGAKARVNSGSFTRPIRLRSGQAAEAPLFHGLAYDCECFRNVLRVSRYVRKPTHRRCAADGARHVRYAQRRPRSYGRIHAAKRDGDGARECAFQFEVSAVSLAPTGGAAEAAVPT